MEAKVVEVRELQSGNDPTRTFGMEDLRKIVTGLTYVLEWDWSVDDLVKELTFVMRSRPNPMSVKEFGRLLRPDGGAE
jgi:hypothetical protein